ncbi:MAG: efflux RND transporter periplasmic adaptor subunit [Coxiellaceae bacterium]|nr:efflux RND transporter periplasmic adaptor subunit [Coxiellaceae bacterium]
MVTKQRRKIIIAVSSAIIALLTVSIGGVVHAQHKHKKSKALLLAQANTPIVVRITPVKQINVADSVQATGTLLPIHTTTITPKTNGYIKTINFHEGDPVKAGQLLIQLDNSQEKGNLAQAKATLEIERNSYDRNFKANKQHLVATEDLSKIQSGYESAKADLIMKQTLFNQKALHAPFAGTIGKFLLSVGDYVKAGTPLVTLTNDTKLIVQYTLPQQYINQLKLNQPVHVELSDTHQKIKPANGKISFISQTIDATSQTFVVHAIVNNKAHLLHPGNFVKVQQNLGKAKQQLVIPLRSVIRSISGSSVFIARKGVSQQVNIKLGSIVGHDVVVKSGLKLGDKIIIEGQSQVKPGSHITVVSP